MERLKINVSDVKSINSVNITLNKINIVAGINGSGKSTMSRLLYCFIKTFSPQALDYLKKKLVYEVNFYKRGILHNYTKQFPKLTVENTYEEIFLLYQLYKNIFFEEGLDKSFKQQNMTHIYKEDFKEKDEMFESYLKNDLSSKFHIMKLLMFDEAISRDCDVSFSGDSFKFNINDEKSSHYSSNFDFNVFYMDTFSIFNVMYRSLEHVDDIEERVRSKIYGEDTNNLRVNIIKKIEELTSIRCGNADVEYSFYNEDDINSSLTTPSGVKQIAALMMLLNERMLNKGDFLIIDEPEVNLHPTWQVIFAEILVLLVKDFDLQIYLNSHSPLFIEAMDTFCEYYDMQDDISFFLTEETENRGKYDFNKIESDELYKVYSNLSDAYYYLDQIKLRKQFQ